MTAISETEFKDWLESPVTKEVFKFYHFQGELHRRMVAQGACKASSRQDTGYNYELAMERINMYGLLPTVTWQDMKDMYEYVNQIKVDEAVDANNSDREQTPYPH